MAHISLSASTQHGSTITVDPPMAGAECLSIRLNTNIAEDNPYSRDWVTIHGTAKDLTLLAESMVAALSETPCK